MLFEAINLIIHMDSEPGLLVRACSQLGQFLQHRETKTLSVGGMLNINCTTTKTELRTEMQSYSLKSNLIIC